ncbi:MAG: hypothetical protein H5T64_12790 [Chloroflexi bacterium]|nr:hypothetical protein [Chloroflexota bacterium]
MHYLKALIVAVLAGLVGSGFMLLLGVSESTAAIVGAAVTVHGNPQPSG